MRLYEDLRAVSAAESDSGEKIQETENVSSSWILFNFLPTL
jgi:hypothetical protein